MTLKTTPPLPPLPSFHFVREKTRNLEFVPRPFANIDEFFLVTASNGDEIGKITWRPYEREYVFYPLEANRKPWINTEAIMEIYAFMNKKTIHRLRGFDHIDVHD